eukprot:Anaeramoba_ignava/c7852_g1_i1.p1 GENE.c7852_g1_i1~~c7852_g1_i1.p1  ORF type:complete len:243 (+),score=65.19 c7852_g1_i1:283-1011(+)
MSIKDGQNWLEDCDIENFISWICDLEKKENILLLHPASISVLREILSKIDLDDNLNWIVIPVNYEVHWCLILINKRETNVEYYNSKQGYDEMKDFAEEIAQNGNYGMINVFDKEIQHNSNDCGVFVCKFFYKRIIKSRSISRIIRHFCHKETHSFRRQILEVLKEKDLSERDEQMIHYSQFMDMHIACLRSDRKQINSKITEDKKKELELRMNRRFQNFRRDSRNYYGWKKLIEEYQQRKKN